MAEATFIWGTGKRKCAIARVRLRRGSGKVEVNGKDVSEYFPRRKQVVRIMEPFQVIGRPGDFDVVAQVYGGGVAGHADAVRLGVSRALVAFDATFRRPLKDSGCLTRDARIKERKKYGQKGARKKVQFSKR
jgi:small subunit ribosomal protein S9